MGQEIVAAIISSVLPSAIDSIKSIAKKKLERLNNTEIGLTEDNFSEYLHRMNKKYSVINTLALKNQQTLLKDLYIPLTLRIEDGVCENEKLGCSDFKIEGYPKEMIEKYMRLMIIDSAGMGKSTLTRRMFIDVIENAYGIPVLIDLRRLSDSNDIINETYNQFNPLNKSFNRDAMLEFIIDGQLIFFFDGYDEIPSRNREFVTSNITEFISKASDNYYIMTSRPDNSLSCFGDFQNAKIMPLKKKEAYELIRRYDKIGELSKRLIEKLKEPSFNMMDEFLINPLLVTLLFVSFKFKETIPPKKHLFYEQVFYAYYDSHDLSKGDSFSHEKKSNLDMCEFDKVLRYLGLKCVLLQETEFSQSDLKKMIQEVKDECCGIDFSVTDFFADIVSSVPLFIQDGLLFRWAHKSIQEYFCAKYIYVDSREKQNDYLLSIYNSENIGKYANVLDIYYDMDYEGFRHSILFNFYKEYIDCYDLMDNSIDSRVKELLVNKEYYYIFSENVDVLDKNVRELAIKNKYRRITIMDIGRNLRLLECFRHNKFYYLFNLFLNKNNRLGKRSKVVEHGHFISNPVLNTCVPLDDITCMVILGINDLCYFDYSMIKEEYDSIIIEKDKKLNAKGLFN